MSEAEQVCHKPASCEATADTSAPPQLGGVGRRAVMGDLASIVSEGGWGDGNEKRVASELTGPTGQASLDPFDDGRLRGHVNTANLGDHSRAGMGTNSRRRALRALRLDKTL